MENIEQRLKALEKAILALSDEAWSISETEGRATTPYLNIPCLLADAARACAFAIRIEQEKKEAVDA
jgi:hypothetical protein